MLDPASGEESCDCAEIKLALPILFCRTDGVGFATIVDYDMGECLWDGAVNARISFS